MELVTIASATAAAGLLASGAGRLVVAGWRRASATYQQYRFQNQIQQELGQQTNRARLVAQANWQNAHRHDSAWRVMEVVEIVDESSDVRSFYLQDPLSTSSLPQYKPGQFLIVRPALGGVELPARCYSLSDAPGQSWYRISVKRQAYDDRNQLSLSNWLHDHIQTGDCLLTSGPHGEFVLSNDVTESSPIVLLAAGVGITPILSMVKSLLTANAQRPVWLFHQVTDEEHWPFGELIHRWAGQCPGLVAHSFFSRLSDAELPTVSGGLTSSGKFNGQSIVEHLPSACEAHYFMCGPEAWMQSLRGQLSGFGISDERIHWESFAGQATSSNEDGVEPWSIRFRQSAIQSNVSDSAATVLSAATALGLQLPAACHSGVCGTCKLKLLKGSVKYAKRPGCQHSDSEVVACVAQPVGDIEVDA